MEKDRETEFGRQPRKMLLHQDPCKADHKPRGMLSVQRLQVPQATEERLCWHKQPRQRAIG